MWELNNPNFSFSFFTLLFHLSAVLCYLEYCACSFFCLFVCLTDLILFFKSFWEFSVTFLSFFSSFKFSSIFYTAFFIFSFFYIFESFFNLGFLFYLVRKGFFYFKARNINKTEVFKRIPDEVSLKNFQIRIIKLC